MLYAMRGVCIFFCLCVFAYSGPGPAIPAKGCYVGAVVQSDDPLYVFNEKTGVQHAMFARFFRFPELFEASAAGESQKQNMERFLEQCRSVGAIPVLCLETVGGLDSYTDSQVRRLAEFLGGWNMPMILRWNHEMNGNWYPWGQQPGLYIKKFRAFADVIHRYAPRVAMAWTPNQGWGYGWDGRDMAQISAEDAQLLDTDGNGVLTQEDDPYGPYYPGDKYVDWVGLSFYHWGGGARGLNKLPHHGFLGQALGVESREKWLDFSKRFSKSKRKPMLLAETAAFYDPLDTKKGGALERDIKQAWIDQVYNTDDRSMPRLTDELSGVKGIIWFNVLKYESEVDGEVDWRVSGNEEVSAVYRKAVDKPHFVKGSKLHDAVSISYAPKSVIENRSYQVRIRYQAVTDRMIMVSILDPENDHAWYGGCKKRVAKGRGELRLMVKVDPGKPASKNCIWDAVAVPIDGDWKDAFANDRLPVAVLK